MNSRSIIPSDAPPTGGRRPRRWYSARGRHLALASLVSILLLATLWSVASVSGFGFFGSEKVREASAQTPGEEQQQIGQNDPAGGGPQQNGVIQENSQQTGDSDTAGYNEEAYAAFGEERNPFRPVVSQASEAGDGTGGSSTEGGGGDDVNADGDGDGAGGEDATANANTSGGPTSPAGGGDNGETDGGDGNRPSGQEREDMVTAPDGEMVDCSDTESDFERIICEEERQAGDEDSGDTTQAPRDGGDRQGSPGSGGSGRSGSGDTADDFRNGGGGVSK